MLQAVQRYFRNALRFPNRDVGTLRWIRTGSMVMGVLSVLQAWLWTESGRWWSAALWILMALVWSAQGALAVRELRRRADSPGA